MTTRPRSAFSTRFLLGLIVLGGAAHVPARMAADTVQMKNGGKIENWRVLEQANGSIELRTPAGPMVVPIAAVHGVLRARSVFDVYDDALMNRESTFLCISKR